MVQTTRLIEQQVQQSVDPEAETSEQYDVSGATFQGQDEDSMGWTPTGSYGV
jgi:hypothetical protein